MIVCRALPAIALALGLGFDACRTLDEAALIAGVAVAGIGTFAARRELRRRQELREAMIAAGFERKRRRKGVPEEDVPPRITWVKGRAALEVTRYNTSRTVDDFKRSLPLWEDWLGVRFVSAVKMRAGVVHLIADRLPERLDVRELPQPPAPLVVPFAVDHSRRVLLQDFNEAPGLFIGGMSGAGKSSATRTVVRGAIASCAGVGGLRVLILDPKGGGDYADLLDGDDVEVFNPCDAEAIPALLARLREISAEAQAGLKRKSETGVRHLEDLRRRGESVPFRRTLIVADEAPAYMQPKDVRDPKTKEAHAEIVALLEKAAATWRVLGAGFVVVSQGAAKDDIALPRRNFATWLLARVEKGVSDYYLGTDLAAQPTLGAGVWVYKGPAAPEPILVRVARSRGPGE